MQLRGLDLTIQDHRTTSGPRPRTRIIPGAAPARARLRGKSVGSAPCQPPLTDVSGAVAATARRLVVLAFDVDPRPPEPPAELLHGRLNAGQDANSDEVR